MPRTTINIDARVLAELKRRQRAEGKPLGQIVSELLAAALAETEVREPPPALAWTAKPMGARVDLDDKDALWGALEAPDSGAG